MQYFSEALGFCSKYFYLYRRKYFLLLWDYSTSGSKAQAVKSNVILQHAVSFSPFFTFSQTSCLLFEKLVFHGEEHHQSNSKKKSPKYFIHRTFGQFRVQLLTDASYKGKCILLWEWLSWIHTTILWPWMTKNWLYSKVRRKIWNAEPESSFDALPTHSFSPFL